jgi:hypothetical protein
MLGRPNGAAVYQPRASAAPPWEGKPLHSKSYRKLPVPGEPASTPAIAERIECDILLALSHATPRTWIS